MGIDQIVPALLGGQTISRGQIDAHWHVDARERFPLEGRTAIDVGCGAGLLAEPLARMGAQVTGVDAAPENIAAALDRWLRAYDSDTGRELWRGPLPESGRATPMGYRLDSGAEYVAIAVGGGEVFGAGDYVVAFRLPPAPSAPPAGITAP